MSMSGRRPRSRESAPAPPREMGSVSRQPTPRWSLRKAAIPGRDNALVEETRDVGSSDAASLSRPQQAGDFLGLAQYRHRNRRRPLGAAAQHAVDMAGIGEKPAHLVADPAEHLDRERRKRLLECREILPRKACQRRFPRDPGERG